jgi:hypothetical protein
MTTLLEEFPELKKCIEGAHINAVRNAIQMGNSLHLIKIAVKDKKESWLDFMKENFSISTRACQNFMKLAKTSIHETHYKYGTEELLKLIRDGHDVSHSLLDPHCQGCQDYKPCFNITDNQTGNCPCSDCISKSKCEDLCDNWHEWINLLKL